MEEFLEFEKSSVFVSNHGNIKYNNEIVELTINNVGYLFCKIDNQYYNPHRLVALLFCPKPDETFNVVDHIDGNRTNNHYQNLRWTNKSLNGKNKKIKNKYGISGIYEIDDKYILGGKIYKSCIGYNKKLIVLGYYKNVNEAIEARIKKEKELYGEYSRYHQNKS
jgi:hypothetical protein